MTSHELECNLPCNLFLSCNTCAYTSCTMLSLLTSHTQSPSPRHISYMSLTYSCWHRCLLGTTRIYAGQYSSCKYQSCTRRMSLRLHSLDNTQANIRRTSPHHQSPKMCRASSPHKTTSVGSQTSPLLDNETMHELSGIRAELGMKRVGRRGVGRSRTLAHSTIDRESVAVFATVARETGGGLGRFVCVVTGSTLKALVSLGRRSISATLTFLTRGFVQHIFT